MCVSGCLRCVGVALVALATVCVVSNLFLLFPNLETRFLPEGHVTREATWSAGLWGSGLLTGLLGAKCFLVSSRTSGCCAFRGQMCSLALYSLVCVGASGFCCLVSLTGLVQGPLCLYNSSSSGPVWGVPLRPTPDRDPGYLWNSSLWSGVCLEPRAVVQWNVLWFSLQSACSLIQTLLCAANVLNALAGLVLGRGLRPNKVAPVKA